MNKEELLWGNMLKPIIAWVKANCKFAWSKPRKYDIFSAFISIGRETKVRPVLVLYADQNVALVAPMSSSFEYQKEGDFAIRKDHPDFSSTKLNDSGFVKGWSIYVPVRDIQKKIGVLSGSLLTQYIKSSPAKPVNINPLSTQRSTPKTEQPKVEDQSNQPQEMLQEPSIQEIK
jgi:hypothetical protein